MNLTRHSCELAGLHVLTRRSLTRRGALDESDILIGMELQLTFDELSERHHGVQAALRALEDAHLEAAYRSSAQ